MATEYSTQNARLALPVLIECARDKGTLTYSELGTKIGRHYRAMPHLLEVILRACHKVKVPTIGTLVVSGTTGLPGDGFIVDGQAKKLVYGGAEYNSLVEAEQNSIYSWQDWDPLLKEFGLK